MHKRIKAGVGIAAVMAAAASLGSITSANADAQPHANDIVGVGSDTVQYVGDFVADGDNAGNPGYNSVEKTRRIFNFDATASAGGNSVYGKGAAAYGPLGASSGSTGNVATALTGANTGTNAGPAQTAVFRAGTNPLWRVNGSGDGIGELINDTTAPYYFQYVRSSRLPKATEITALQAAFPAVGAVPAGIELYRIATDGMDIAVNNNALNNGSVAGLSATDPLSCAPALSNAELLAIYNGTYKTWGAIPGYVNPAGSNCSTEGIVPTIPQAGSGTRGDFESSIGITDAGLASNVVVSEEHDPGAIGNFVATTDVNGNPVGRQDVISPFSTGRYNLIQSTYFDHALAVKSPATLSYKESGIIALVTTGTPPDAGAIYHYNRNLYILVRQSDLASATPFLPGGALNWVNTLFGSATSYFAKASNAALFTSAGVTQAWKDCGPNATTC